VRSQALYQLPANNREKRARKAIMDYHVGLVVPCYNEEKRLNVKAYLSSLSKNVKLTILFVNDGSSDNTLNILQKISKAEPERAMYLSLDRNKGKAEAVRQGICHLLKMDTFEIIGYWDADLAVPLIEVNDFIRVFQTYPDVQAVIGSRVHLAGRAIEHVNLRHYFGRVFATIISLTFGFKIYDTQCGAKLFYSKILEPVVKEIFCSNWIFDVELLIRLSRIDFLRRKENWLYEYPVHEWKNVSDTKRTFLAYIESFFDYFKLVRKYGLSPKELIK